MRTKSIGLTLAIGMMIASFYGRASSAELITNGGFETANFTGWTVTNASGSWMDWQVSPIGAGGGFNPPYVTAPQNGTRSAWNGVTANANQQYILYQTVTIPSGQSASISWKDRFQMNLFDFCTSAAACGQAFYIVDITNTSGVVLQTLYSVTAPPLTKTDTGWINHGANMSAFAGQTIRIRFRSWGTITFAGPGQAEIDSVSLQSPLGPTNAHVQVLGRVTAANRGVYGAIVTLTDENGEILTAMTNGFGYYTFAEVEAGKTYVVEVSSKRYTFDANPRLITIVDTVTDLDFTASP